MTMDLSNLKNLIQTDDNQSPDLSDDDLEDELNAIISGQTFGHKSKQRNTSSDEMVKRLKQNDNKVMKTQKVSKTDKSDDNQYNLLDIQRLGIIEDLDHNLDDDDIDEDNEDLLSEINAIVFNKSSANRQRPQNPLNPYESPSIDSNIQSSNPIHRQKLETITDNSRITHQLDSNRLVSTSQTNVPKIAETVRAVPNKSEQTLIPNKSGFVRNEEIVSKPSDKTNNKNEIFKLTSLRDEYKKSALNAKKSGDQSTAIAHIKTAKQIEVLMEALEKGLAVDLNQLPPPPSISVPTNTVNSLQSVSGSQQTNQTITSPESEDGIEMDVELTTEDAKKFFNAPPPPNTIMEALEQRLAKFKSTQSQANEENNSSKARRLGRIVKQYENAIKDFKKGKEIDFEELPTPPGFGPIPVVSSTQSVPKTNAEQRSEASNINLKPTPAPKPPENRPIIANKSPQNDGRVSKPAIQSTSPNDPQRPALKRASSTANKQLNYLLERQRLFKEAALESKQKGDIQQAKEYLRMSKGFDPLIEATQNGLPIDATSIPTPPQMNDDFVIVSHPETSNVNDMEKEEMFRKLEVELQNQIEMCKRNKEYFLQLGDISTSSKFEKYTIDSKKDLDMLTILWKNGQKVPNFKYETRTFSIVICNTEVTANEVSVEVVKAVDIPGKSDVDTYIRMEFPFPTERNPTARTKTVKNTINPVFNETFKFEIDRKSRQLPRIFKRHPIKLELMSKGGFLRGDSLIGTALIKLVDFETKCTIHDTFPLTEGRKAVGGRVEARVRIREPLLAKQVEEVKEKWLIFV